MSYHSNDMDENLLVKFIFSFICLFDYLKGSFQQMWVSKQEYDEIGPSVIHDKCKM